jgi:hypothetical protein
VGKSTAPIFLEARMTDVQNVQDSGSEEVSEEFIIYALTAYGINSCFSSYDSKLKLMADNFFKLNLGTISKMWDSLDDRVKVKVINVNSEAFKSWINSFSKES